MNSHRQAIVTYVSVCIAILLTALAACSRKIITPSPAVREPTTDSAVTVLEHVGVVDVDRGVLLRDMAVEIRGDRIQAVTHAEKYSPPRGAKILDLSGRYIVPGFVEMHAHLFLPPWDENGQIIQRYDRSTILKMLRVLLSEGITTVRDAGAPTEAAITLRQMLLSKKVVGPFVLTAGRMLNTGDFNAEPFALVTDEDDVREEVRWQAAAGVDFIKVYSGMPPALVKAAIDEAHAHRLRVIGHLQRTTWTEAAEMGIDAIAHSAPWSPEYLPESARANYEQTLFGRVYWLEHCDLNSPAINSMIDALVKHGVAVDPTLIAMHTKFWGNDSRYLQHPDMNFAPELFSKGWPKGSFTASWTPEQYKLAQAQWPKVLALTRKMFDRGVLLTAGTDTPTPWIIPGTSFHEELQLLSESGIPAPALLRMATINGARALGLDDEFGKIKIGLRADLVVLYANPLDDIRNTGRIQFVIRGGDIYEPQKLLGRSNRR